MSKGKMIAYGVILGILVIGVIYWNFKPEPLVLAAPETAFTRYDIKLGDKDVVDAYLKEHSDVNATITYKDPDSGKEIATTKTPLACAVSGGHPDLVKLLMGKGAKVEGVKIVNKTLTEYVTEQKEKTKEAKWDQIAEALGATSAAP